LIIKELHEKCSSFSHFIRFHYTIVLFCLHFNELEVISLNDHNVPAILN